VAIGCGCPSVSRGVQLLVLAFLGIFHDFATLTNYAFNNQNTDALYGREQALPIRIRA
jgi:hypothetical protein